MGCEAEAGSDTGWIAESRTSQFTYPGKGQGVKPLAISVKFAVQAAKVRTLPSTPC